MTIKLGITGGIGSGKSIVSKLLETMGVPVYISDVEAKRLMHSDAVIRRGLISLLGESVYEGDCLNKELLASYIFTDKAHLQAVNALVHPQVKKDFRLWAERHSGYPLLGIESAILIEAGFADEVDAVLMVYAPKEIRVERAMKRDSTDRESVERRMENQMSDEEKRELADYVILNDEHSPLIPQVLKTITSLSKNIPYLCSPKK